MPKAERDEAFISPYLKSPPRSLEDVLRERDPPPAAEIAARSGDREPVEADKA